MRVLFDHQIFSLQRYGGISRYFSELAVHIKNQGHQVEVFAPLSINEYLCGSSVQPRASITIPHLFNLGRALALGAGTLLAPLAVAPKRDVDIFHETFYYALNLKPVSAKRVVTVHDMIYERFPNEFPHQNLVRRMKARAVARADHIICVSENTRRDLIDLLAVPEQKTSVVHHGSALPGTPIQNRRLAPRPYLLFVGRRAGYKNFEGLLRAYGSSDSLRKHFSLVCFGDRPFSAGEHAMIRSLRLSSQDVLHMSGDDGLLASAYRFAAAFVFPSVYEGFGIPPLEAMAFGCPVVCANNSSLPEVVGDAAELFDPHDTDDTREAIERVVFSGEHRTLLVEKGHRRILHFSWEKCARDTIAVYEKVRQS